MKSPQTISYIGQDPELMKYIHRWDSMSFEYVDEDKDKKFLEPLSGMGYCIYPYVKDIYIRMPRHPYDGDSFGIMDVTGYNDEAVWRLWFQQGKIPGYENYDTPENIKSYPVSAVNLDRTLRGQVWIDNRYSFITRTRVLYDCSYKDFRKPYTPLSEASFNQSPDAAIYRSKWDTYQNYLTNEWHDGNIDPGETYRINPTNLCLFWLLFTYSKEIDCWTVRSVSKECVAKPADAEGCVIVHSGADTYDVTDVYLQSVEAIKDGELGYNVWLYNGLESDKDLTIDPMTHYQIRENQIPIKEVIPHISGTRWHSASQLRELYDFLNGLIPNPPNIFYCILQVYISSDDVD